MDASELAAASPFVLRQGEGGVVNLILPRSTKVVATGKRACYRRIEEPLERAYATASDSMASSMIEPDAAEGIDAFIEKRTARWPRW